METISGGPSEQFLPDTILQAAKLNKALENWVVTEVPGEDEGEIGDVVFVTGPGDGGSSPVGGGKVLQVVRATDYGTKRETVSSTFQDVPGMSVTITPTQASSHLMITATFLLNPPTNVRPKVRILDSNDVLVEGTENIHQGGWRADIAAGWVYTTIVGFANPSSTESVTYRLQWNTSADTAVIHNEQTTGQMIVHELEDVVVSP